MQKSIVMWHYVIFPIVLYWQTLYQSMPKLLGYAEPKFQHSSSNGL